MSAPKVNGPTPQVSRQTMIVNNVQKANGPLLLALHPMTSVLMSALKGSGLMSLAWLLMSNAKNVPKESGLTKQNSRWTVNVQSVLLASTRHQDLGNLPLTCAKRVQLDYTRRQVQDKFPLTSA